MVMNSRVGGKLRDFEGYLHNPADWQAAGCADAFLAFCGDGALANGEAVLHGWHVSPLFYRAGRCFSGGL